MSADRRVKEDRTSLGTAWCFALPRCQHKGVAPENKIKNWDGEASLDAVLARGIDCAVDTNRGPGFLGSPASEQTGEDRQSAVGLDSPRVACVDSFLRAVWFRTPTPGRLSHRLWIRCLGARPFLVDLRSLTSRGQRSLVAPGHRSVMIGWGPGRACRALRAPSSVVASAEPKVRELVIRGSFCCDDGEEAWMRMGSGSYGRGS